MTQKPNFPAIEADIQALRDFRDGRLTALSGLEWAEQAQTPTKTIKQPTLPAEAWIDKSRRVGVDYLAINKDIAGGKK